MFAVRSVMLLGVGLVAFAAAVFGAGAAVAVADGLFTVLGWLIRAVQVQRRNGPRRTQATARTGGRPASTITGAATDVRSAAIRRKQT